MKQKVTVSQWFSDLSRRIKILDVYQKDNTLIAVSQILQTGNMGEAVYTSKDSMLVETNADHNLPVKTVILAQGKTLDSINEIKGLQPLQRVNGLASTQGVFANNESDNEDSEEVHQSYQNS